MLYTLNHNNLLDDDKKMTDSYTPPEIDTVKKPLTTGAYLKSVRLQKNLTEEDIYKYLKIKARIVVAIENHHYTSLPHTVTVAALVRQYALFLGLDPVDISTAYKKEMTGTDQKIEVVFPDKLPSSFKPFKQSIIATLIVLAVYFVWHLLGSTSNLVPQVSPVTNTDIVDDTQSSKIQADTVTESETVTQEITPVIHFDIIKTPQILLKATGGQSWIEVKDIKNNRVIYSAILQNGESYKIPSDLTGLRLKAGNSIPLSITINNEIIDILPKDNRVLRNFNIDSENLLKIYNQQKKNTLQTQ
jgi:hypothetical protein